MPAVIDVHIAYSTRLPIDRTVFTDVCTISGERSCDRGQQHALEGEVVEDVDRRDAVALLQRRVDDVLEGNDGHAHLLVRDARVVVDRRRQP